MGYPHKRQSFYLYRVEPVDFAFVDWGKDQQSLGKISNSIDISGVYDVGEFVQCSGGFREGASDEV